MGNIVIPSYTHGQILFGFGIFAVFTTAVFYNTRMMIAYRLNPPNWNAMYLRLISRKWNPRDAVDIMVILMGCLLVTYAFIGDMLETGMMTKDDVPFTAIIAQNLLIYIPVLVCVIYQAIRNKSNANDAFGITFQQMPGDIWKGIKYYFAMIPAVFISVIFMVLISEQTGMKLEEQEIITTFRQTNDVWLKNAIIGSAIISAPIMEEILFRGMGLPIIARMSGGLTLPIILISTLFGSIHASLSGLLPLTIVGIALALAYISSGSLLVPITMHMLFNSGSMFLLYLVKYLDIDKLKDF